MNPVDGHLDHAELVLLTNSDVTLSLLIDLIFTNMLGQNRLDIRGRHCIGKSLT
jgi:hypothetical protein